MLTQSLSSFITKQVIVILLYVHCVQGMSTFSWIASSWCRSKVK